MWPSSRALPEVLLGAIFKKDQQYQFYFLGVFVLKKLSVVCNYEDVRI